MGKRKPKRRRPAKARTLPPDATSLEVVIRVVHRAIQKQGAHLRQGDHDLQARRGFGKLYDLRCSAWARLYSLNPGRALAIAAELNLTAPSAALLAQL